MGFSNFTEANGRDISLQGEISCARGFMQKPGRDYSETFSPGIKFHSLRVFLAMVTQRNLEPIQFDIRTAFLYGKLSDCVFMKISE